MLGLLLQKLRDDGCQAYYLQGKGSIETLSGIEAFPRLPGALAKNCFLALRLACLAGATSPTARILPSRAPRV